ncbi:MAG TPA: UPF0182 family protein [Thermomicrobiales bacterium]
MIITAVVIFALIILLFVTSAFWVNWWWFGSMGYRDILVTRYTAQVAAFIIGGLAAAAIFAVNGVLALRRTRIGPPGGRVVRFAERALLAILGVATVLIFLAFGAASASRWETWLLWLNGRSFGQEDPVFGRDAGFYIFALPALRAIDSGAFTLLVLTVIAVAAIYALRLGVRVRSIRAIPAMMRVHLFALGGAILAVVAVRYLLQTYELVYSERGEVFFGANYTDVNVQRPVNWLLFALTLATAVLLVLNAFVRRLRLLVGVVIAWAVAAVVLGVLLPSAIQSAVVEPSQLRRERTYIAHNIAMTRAAFGLDDVTNRELSGREALDPDALADNEATLENIRLWDYRIARGTYQQLQSFVPYYVFPDVDVERYIVDGRIQQVLVAARELDQDGLPEGARTWTNRRLVYTHGYGVVVSPVSGVTAQGLPTFIVEGIPPTGTAPYRIERPEIYFGELTGDWVIVNTEEGEFQGLAETNAADVVATYHYAGEGRGSIKLDSAIRRWLLAAHFRDRNIALSGQITDESLVLLRRDVLARAREIAPFLQLDPDPYLVIADGRLVWIIDAYTATDRYPYATRTRGVNYMRNSVKVVIDAYDGTTTFYRTAEPDPIADAWGGIFDDLFRPISEAPPSIAQHFRYPELLFDIQSEIYATMHVTDPTAFYNGEDRWAVPLEQVGDGRSRMEPYYVTMTLPGETEPGFALIRPFIPGGRTDRQNMTAWMAGRTDESGALSLVTYRFPRQATVFGPSQVEARIDQEPEISSQIALWNQSGSQVLRGNLLVIPIGESLLYVQPLYLQATRTPGALPELRRVIVATSDRVLMRATLADAIAALADEEPTTAEDGGAAPPGETETVASLAQQALEAYNRAQEALVRGDWAAYGREQATLQELLERIAALTAGEAPEEPAPTDQATPEAGGS